jgi:hypothetical protein
VLLLALMLMVVFPSIPLLPLFRGFTKPMPMPLMSQYQLLLTLQGKQSQVQHVLLKLRMLLSKLAFDPEMVQLQLICIKFCLCLCCYLTCWRRCYWLKLFNWITDIRNLILKRVQQQLNLQAMTELCFMSE